MEKRRKWIQAAFGVGLCTALLAGGCGQTAGAGGTSAESTVKTSGDDRLVGFTPTEQYFAKGCYGVQGLLKLPRLDDGVPNDFLGRLFERVRENIRQEAAAHRGEQEAYEAAMEQARELIEGIHDPATALETAHQLKKLSHYLTSEREAKALLAAKIKALGMHWDREAGAYAKA